MTRRISILLAVSTVLLTMALTVGVRLAGPADLYEKDQPKTLAYTADVLIHGRLALPRDVIYQPATKPPLYNWVAAAVVSVAGYTEWAMKSPSILGTLATAAIIFGMARRGISVKGKNCDAWLLGCLAAAIWFTFGSDVRHGSVMRLGYLARPDMLQCAFLTAAWACATIAVQRSSPKAAFWPAMGFWASVAAAALTKGPAVLLVIVFALVYAGWPLILRLLPQKRMIVAQPLGTRFKHLWLPIGAAGVALVVGLWFWQAYRTDPDHVRSVMLGAEIAGRLSDQSPEGIKKPVYYSLMWFITKAVPWGGVALLSLMVLMIARHFVGAILVSSVER
ncbi:MAG TPA: glycosyltransferase family 39 protein, partial [Tepidisphaeraceae bacterium]